MAGDKKRTRRTPTARIRWTEDMERKILEYARDCLQNGRDFEKPSAPEYYRKFLESSSSDFEEVTVDKMVQHMKTLKKTYTSALEWRNKTGEGILLNDPASGEQTISSVLAKRCKYFTELDEILGEKPQFNPPYILNCGTDTNGEPLNINDEWDNDLDDDLQNLRNETLTSPGTATGPGTSTGSETFTAQSDQEDVQIVTFDTPAFEPPTHKKLKRTPVKSAAAALEGAMKSRMECETKRLEWEKLCEDKNRAEIEAKRQDEINLKHQELDFAKQKWQDKLSQKKQSEDRQYELEKMRLENEMELARFKVEKEFELEKLKLEMAIK